MMRLSRQARRVLWVAAAAAFIAIFAFAGRGDGSPPTPGERAEQLSRQFACPECAGQSVAASDAPAAQNIRNVINELVDRNETDDAIRTYIVDRFGERVSLVPASDGVVGLVWVIPVVVAVLSVAALLAVLLRWRRSVGEDGAVSAEDRALVERFLAERQEATEADALR